MPSSEMLLAAGIDFIQPKPFGPMSRPVTIKPISAGMGVLANKVETTVIDTEVINNA